MQTNIIPGNHDNKRKRRITMVVKLSGELGNNLMHLSHAYAMKRQVEERIPGITIELVGEHQDVAPGATTTTPAWTKAARDIRQCFPNLQSFDFESGKFSPEFLQRQSALVNWLKSRRGSMDISMLNVDAGSTANDRPAETSLKTLQVLLKKQQQHASWNVPIQEPPNATISLPYLRVENMVGGTEKYLEDIQRWMAFDTKAPGCCGILPDPDELVFHFRNYVGGNQQLAERLASRGFVEVGPQHVGQMLQGLLAEKKLTKVAFVTRRYKSHPTAADQHINALQNTEGIDLRVIPKQTGVQDFCFLLHAKHIVSSRLSSYSDTAAMLGNQTSFVSYMIQTPHIRTNHNSHLLKPRAWWNASEVFRKRFQQVNYPNEYIF